MMYPFVRPCLWLVGAASLAASLACDMPAVALHPLSASDTSRRWEPRLIGTWMWPDDSSSTRWVVTRAGYYRYRVTLQSQERTQELTAYLVTVDGFDFLDLAPDFEPIWGPEMLRAPVHFLARARVRRDTLWLGWPSDHVWIERLEHYGAPVIHEPGGNLVLTVGTDTLRAFFHTILQDSLAEWHTQYWVHADRRGFLVVYEHVGEGLPSLVDTLAELDPDSLSGVIRRAVESRMQSPAVQADPRCNRYFANSFGPVVVATEPMCGDSLSMTGTHYYVFTAAGQEVPLMPRPGPYHEPGFETPGLVGVPSQMCPPMRTEQGRPHHVISACPAWTMQ